MFHHVHITGICKFIHIKNTFYATDILFLNTVYLYIVKSILCLLFGYNAGCK